LAVGNASISMNSAYIIKKRRGDRVTVKKRKDNWTKEDDLVLAETVLQCVREGKTQLFGFEEAARKLGRTKQACGFRWNKNLRDIYKAELDEAKRKPENHVRSHLKMAITSYDQLSEAHLKLKRDYEKLSQDHHRLLSWLSKGFELTGRKD
jgi:prespore-specific regulator